MKHIFYFLLFFSFLTCNEKQQTTKVESKLKTDTTVLTKIDISKINYIDYGVDTKAKNTLDAWQAYNTIAVAVNGLKSANFDFFKEDNSVFIPTIKELETTIPDKINIDPIQARMLILKTKLLKLEEVINLKTTQKKEKLLVIKEVFEAFSNMTLQINKKFEKEAQSIIKPDEL
ncbi:hypothetical protein [uncultured Lacinutrix sp.]|uniref:hypothetical protein n=1 Tax=uncultured Lacinutrix sp. TaxID=574032 RepID=UPI002601B81F|nr:hypothetical protein [uncultured Lacinutrix sp.]